MENGHDPSRLKRPESVLVLVFNEDAELLVLERCQPEGFHQSVTGSLEAGESFPEAAVRELKEETGLEPLPVPVETGLSSEFEILPAWRHRFPPGTRSNHERVFVFRVSGRPPIRLNLAEHCSFQWLPFDRALTALTSWTNRRAVVQLLPMCLP